MVYKAADLALETRTEMRGGNGQVLMQHLEKDNLPANGRLFAKLTLAPGCSIGEHQHVGESELFYFISGAGIALDDGVEIPVAAGDVMTTLDGHSHSIANTGTVDMEVVAVIIK